MASLLDPLPDDARSFLRVAGDGFVAAGGCWPCWQWVRQQLWTRHGLMRSRSWAACRPGSMTTGLSGSVIRSPVVSVCLRFVSSCLYRWRCAPFRDVPDNAFTRSARISLSARMTPPSSVLIQLTPWASRKARTCRAGLAPRSLCARPPRSQRGAGPARRRFCGAGGTTFPARARAAGITTSAPSEVRTAKEAGSFSSRMPRTSAICSPSPGLGRRQRITTRWPTSAGVRRTSSR